MLILDAQFEECHTNPLMGFLKGAVPRNEQAATARWGLRDKLRSLQMAAKEQSACFLVSFPTAVDISTGNRRSTT